jgi:hypothetical protein
LPLQILEEETVLIDPLEAVQVGMLVVDQSHLKGLVETVSCQWKFGTNYYQLKEWQSHVIAMKTGVRLPNMVDTVVVEEDLTEAEVVMTMVVVAVVAPLHQLMLKGKMNRPTCHK